MPTKPPIPPARWRELSGLTPETEKNLQGKERRAALRKLHAAAEAEIRAELQFAAEDAEFKGERTFLWEPIPAVCRRLEIAPGALNNMLRELTGMSAAQLADKIRAEGLREKIRAELREHIQKFCKKPAFDEHSAAVHLQRFRDSLKSQRAKNGSNCATRALQYGFQNHTRLYRACLLQYGLTPSQLELEILREFAEFFACASNLRSRKEATHYINERKDSYDCHRKPYSDKWEKAAAERPAWLAEMRDSFGLDDEVLAWL